MNVEQSYISAQKNKKSQKNGVKKQTHLFFNNTGKGL
jgi:hypothetical protein